MPAATDQHWIAGLPKAEVHLHLEGCIPPSVIRQGGGGGCGDAQAVAAHDAGARPMPGTSPDAVPVFGDLAEFLDYLDRSCARVTRGDQLERIAYALTERARDSGVGHVDVIFNPTHWPAWQHDLARFVEHLDKGLTAGEEDYGVTAGVCLSLTRTQPAGASIELVDWLLDVRPARIVALSVDGNEAAAGRTGERFRPLFERAREAGLHTCAHAGESSGPEGVRDAVELLGAERIDHGIRAVEDQSLVAELAARGTPLDVCPTSNVRLGVVPSLPAHPIERLRAAGVRVSVNTDDPLLFGTSVASEYGACAAQFGWDRGTLVRIARTSIESCFATPDRRRELLAALDRYDAGLDAPPGRGSSDPRSPASASSIHEASPGRR